MSNNFRAYKNGNYTVLIDINHGTKIRINNEDYMRADFPESMDIKISNRCDMGCPMCHEMSHPAGKLADLNNPIFDTIHPWTEIALGGGNIFEHPDLDDFLFKMARKKVICNATVHVKHFVKHFNDIRYHVDHGTLHGIGVSINEPIGDGVISWLKAIPNVVVHVIAGIVPWETLVKLGNNGIKLLILGYKTYGRGVSYIDNHDVRAQIDLLKNRIGYLYKHFEVVSFDNLALEQLDIRNTVDKDTWEKQYMGDDGTATFFIDAVENTYAKSSISEHLPIDISNVDVLFKRIQNECV